jgi:hypothetical protein
MLSYQLPAAKRLPPTTDQRFMAATAMVTPTTTRLAIELRQRASF